MRQTFSPYLTVCLNPRLWRTAVDVIRRLPDPYKAIPKEHLLSCAYLLATVIFIDGDPKSNDLTAADIEKAVDIIKGGNWDQNVVPLPPDDIRKPESKEKIPIGVIIEEPPKFPKAMKRPGHLQGSAERRAQFLRSFCSLGTPNHREAGKPAFLSISDGASSKTYTYVFVDSEGGRIPKENVGQVRGLMEKMAELAIARDTVELEHVRAKNSNAFAYSVRLSLFGMAHPNRPRTGYEDLFFAIPNLKASTTAEYGRLRELSSSARNVEEDAQPDSNPMDTNNIEVTVDSMLELQSHTAATNDSEMADNLEPDSEEQLEEPGNGEQKSTITSNGTESTVRDDMINGFQTHRTISQKNGPENGESKTKATVDINVTIRAATTSKVELINFEPELALKVLEDIVRRKMT